MDNILAKVESYSSSPWSPGFGLLRFAAGSGPEQKIEILLLFIKKILGKVLRNAPHISRGLGAVQRCKSVTISYGSGSEPVLVRIRHVFIKYTERKMNETRQLNTVHSTSLCV
jgi:hypothetical protein